MAWRFLWRGVFIQVLGSASHFACYRVSVHHFSVYPLPFLSMISNPENPFFCQCGVSMVDTPWSARRLKTFGCLSSKYRCRSTLWCFHCVCSYFGAYGVSKAVASDHVYEQYEQYEQYGQYGQYEQ